MKAKRTHPPKWMDKIIEWYCSKALLEDLQGDLHEYYARNINKGLLKADLIFLLDVIKFCRIYTIRKPKILGQMTFFNLMSNYFKTSIRSLARNRLFSSINIIGLSIAMSIGILMITYVSHLLSFDNFHEKKDRIFKLQTIYTDVTDGDIIDLYSTSVFMADKLKEDYPGVEQVLLMQGSANKDFTYEEKTLQLKGKYASKEFFGMLSYKLVAGDPNTALENPYSIVLTQSAAQKFFEEENPVGKTFQSEENTYTITGLMEDPPLNAHLGKFEMLESFSTRREEEKENKGFGSWNNIWMYHAYLLLDENGSSESIERHLDDISKEENADRNTYSLEYYLVNISDITPGKGQSNNIGMYINWSDVYKLIVLTFIIIASACFNYTNLSVARSLRRAKEVGVRKVVGAGRFQIFTQFLFEATIISLLALVFAYVIYVFIKPEFMREVIDSEGIQLTFKGHYVVLYVLFSIGIGLLAGFLPALILSKLKAISILKDATKLSLFRGLTLRKILIVFQFAASMALIIAATISYRQYEFSINYDMGFRTENVLNVELYDTNVDIELLKAEFAQIPEVQRISTCQMLPGTQSMYMADIVYEEDTLDIFFNKIDTEYIETHDIEFAVGGNFPMVRSDSVAYVIIDEELSKKLGFSTPEEALGERVIYNSDDWKLEISGVMKDYKYADLQNELGPTALIQNYNDRIYYMNLLVESSDMLRLIEKLEGAWSAVDKVHPFEAEFYDVQVQGAYAEYKTMFRLFTFLALIAIFISSMGLLGIAVFTTETRTKEISIRKVLGASGRNLVYLLSKGFLIMLIISALIAIPFSYYLFDQHILTDFRERIDIGLVELLPGVLIIILISFITVSWQTNRAAKTNPVDMLRNE